MPLGAREAIEMFHLVFLRALTAKGVDTALAQKIAALAARTEPQARDVFDLQLLLARTDARSPDLSHLRKRTIADAIERAMGISYDEYRSKVVAYLDPEHAELYEDPTAWDAMQDMVVSRLQELA